MKFARSFIFALPALSVAYPGMGGTSRAEIENYLRERATQEASKKEKRQLLDGVVDTIEGLTNTVDGLLGSVAGTVDPNNKRPEPGFEFREPLPTDSRGPCPGLNLLANHGYLPRDGYVQFGEVVEATARGFNMAQDLAAVLTTFSVLTNGDLDTQSFYLGSGKNGVGGLNRHSTAEADVSPTREDYYNGCGDNHHLASRRFKQNVGFAAEDPNKEFSLNVMAEQYAANAAFSKENNPYIYYFPFPQIVSLGAFAFYPQFFSNGTYGAGGVANYESISSIIGAEYDRQTGEFKYVPERFPENWYRRATPYNAIQALTEAFTVIYPRNIIVPAVGQIGTDNLNPRTVLCDVYQGLNSITPLALGGTVEQTAKGVTWALSVLDPLFKDTALGCPDNVISPNFLYPNASQTGGPQTPPPVPADSNTGDNVYNRVYFTEAPIEPAC